MPEDGLLDLLFAVILPPPKASVRAKRCDQDVVWTGVRSISCRDSQLRADSFFSGVSLRVRPYAHGSVTPFSAATFSIRAARDATSHHATFDAYPPYIVAKSVSSHRKSTKSPFSYTFFYTSTVVHGLFRRLISVLSKT